MKITSLVHFFCLFSTVCLSQTISVGDSVKVRFNFHTSKVKDTADMMMRITYFNVSKRAVNVYTELEEGLINDRFRNIHIEMEKYNRERFVPQAIYYYENAYRNSVIDSLRHFDLPKTVLQPGSSRILSLDILGLAGTFYPGKYRIKVYLRINTKWNLAKYDDTEFETSPPFDELEYVESGWIYFTVTKLVSKMAL